MLRVSLSNSRKRVKGEEKGKEGDSGWETQSEGDSRDWMIRFQLWAAAVEDSAG